MPGDSLATESGIDSCKHLAHLAHLAAVAAPCSDAGGGSSSMPSWERVGRRAFTGPNNPWMSHFPTSSSEFDGVRRVYKSNHTIPVAYLLHTSPNSIYSILHMTHHIFKPMMFSSPISQPPRGREHRHGAVPARAPAADPPPWQWPPPDRPCYTGRVPGELRC